MNAWFAVRGWILAALFIALLAARALKSMDDAPLRPEWLIYIFAAIVLRFWAGAHLGEHGNAARAQASTLATSGPYRLSRNPLYASNILAAAGLVFFANALPLAAEIALVVFVIVHHSLLVRHEERFLRGAHGDAYARYAAETPRWWGLPRPRAIGFGSGSGSSGTRSGTREVLRRQGRNVGYILACAALLWIAAQWF